MLRRQPLLNEEHYHIYNRGAHKQNIFLDEKDYRRFQLLLHILNQSENIKLRAIFQKYAGQSHGDIFDQEKADHSLVDVLAYCLMPNHFHLIVRQKADNGITLFMKKLATGYSMYFNRKHAHSGTLFQGPFKSKYVDSDPYFQWLFSYVHLNPLDLREPGWKEAGKLRDVYAAQEFLQTYTYSSFPDYAGKKRRENAIVSANLAPEWIQNGCEATALLKWFSDFTTQDSPVSQESPV